MINYKTGIISILPLLTLCYYYKKYKKHSENSINEFFNNKNVIITGASQGIGNQLAKRLSKYNCKLFLLARTFKSSNHNNIYKYKCDCSKYNEVNIIIKNIKTSSNKNSEFIVVNCAGSGDWKYLTEMDNKEIIDSIKAPLLSSIFVTKEILEIIDKKITNQLLFIQSPASIQPWKSSTLYSTSRWGMKGFIESLRTDYYNEKIQIKEIILGKVNSNYFLNNPKANFRFPFISKFIPETSLEKSSDIIINTILNNNNTYIYPEIINIMALTHRFFPSLVRYLTCSLGYAHQ